MKNKIIKVLIGIPASGKTSWSEDFVRKNPSWIRVNRDSFRFMLKGVPVCEPKIEELITEMQDQAIETALMRNLNVIVDNTHCKKKYINAIVERFKYSADIEFQYFDISVERAIERDSKREKKVGEKVIKEMYKELKNLLQTFDFQTVKKQTKIYDYSNKDGLPEIFCFDIDGTLAHMHSKRGPFEWSKVFIDDPDESVMSVFKIFMEAGKKIFVISGRDASCRKETEDWLEFHGLKYDKLFMRPKDDFRKDSVIKKEIYANEIEDKYHVVAWIDDRFQVANAMRELGIKVFQVEPGKF